MIKQEPKTGTACGRAKKFAAVSMVTLCGFLAACGTPSGSTSDANIPNMQGAQNFAPKTPEDYMAQMTYWGSIYDGLPDNLEAAVNYGRSLRYVGRAKESVKVLSSAVVNHPKDPTVLAEYGKSLTAAGRAAEGLNFLTQANQRRSGDWANLSAEGVTLDRLGRHDQAVSRYEAALKASPNNPSILNNWALSRALAGDLEQAERLLRQAVLVPDAGVQVRQNLALILGLQGNFAEASLYAEVDLPPEIVAGNMDYIRSMFTQSPQSSPAPSPWSELEALDSN